MKLWHDDIRKPPDETWVWARTNEQAKFLLTTSLVREASLDHDLGLDYLDPDDDPDSMLFAGDSLNGTGLDLVRWMVAQGHVPAKVTIHSWNPAGAAAMAVAFVEAGYDVFVEPFKGR